MTQREDPQKPLFKNKRVMERSQKIFFLQMPPSVDIFETVVTKTTERCLLRPFVELTHFFEENSECMFYGEIFQLPLAPITDFSNRGQHRNEIWIDCFITIAVSILLGSTMRNWTSSVIAIFGIYDVYYMTSSL